MRSIPASDAKNRFGQLVEAAQREPVEVTRQGRPSIVILSAADYARRRRRGWKNLLKVAEETGQYAKARGLTEDKLAELLADES
jgi:prevent-host-death family protein